MCVFMNVCASDLTGRGSSARCSLIFGYKQTMTMQNSDLQGTRSMSLQRKMCHQEPSFFSFYVKIHEQNENFLCSKKASEAGHDSLFSGGNLIIRSTKVRLLFMEGSPGGFIPVLPSGTRERSAVTGHSDVHEQVRTSSGGNVCEVCEMHTNPDVYVFLPFSWV